MMNENNTPELDLTETEQPEEVKEEIVEEAEEAAEEVPACEPAKAEEAPQVKAKKKTPVAAIAVIAVLVVALVVCLIFAISHAKNVQTQTGESLQTEVEKFDPALAHHTNAHGYASWSVHYHTDEGSSNLHYSYLDENAQEITLTADEVNTLLNEVVASCGEETLDNRMLQYYYNEGISTFYNNYYEYISYMLDTSAPLDSQIDNTMGDGSGTWQKSFLDSGLDNFYTVAAMKQAADAEGYTLGEDEQAYLTSLLDLETLAMYYGYPDAVTLLKDMIGPMATVESYQKYIEDTTVASYYTQSLAEGIEITDEQIEAYYTEHEAEMAASYIQKIDKNVMNVRHILIQPETAEDGTISDEAWTAAETEAQRILDEWKAGEATEDTFSELAGTYTQDPGSSSTGGLYENVYPGQMVTEFNDWCFDDAREVGDTGIVKTSYGYHIMYYVSEGDYIYWRNMCQEAILSDKVMTVRDEILSNYETSADTTKMILLDTSAATVPSSTTTEYVAE